MLNMIGVELYMILASRSFRRIVRVEVGRALLEVLVELLPSIYEKGLEGIIGKPSGYSEKGFI